MKWLASAARQGEYRVSVSKNRPQGEGDTVVTETRPDVEAYIYCKGCGTPLGPRSKLSRPSAAVIVMMCETCQGIHGHSLMPRPGAPTFCFRCGTEEEVFVEPGTSPATHHVCPQCLPDRAARYRAGDFVEPPKVPAGGESA